MIESARIRVRYQETDQMGVVWHGNYFSWFEVGRTELFRNAGLPYRELEKQNLFVPVIEANCQYRIPARYDDTLSIETELSRLTGVRIEFSYTVVNQNEEVIAKGFTTHVFVDQNGKPMNLSKANPDLFANFKKLLEKN